MTSNVKCLFDLKFLSTSHSTRIVEDVFLAILDDFKPPSIITFLDDRLMHLLPNFRQDTLKTSSINVE